MSGKAMAIVGKRETVMPFLATGAQTVASGGGYQYD